MIEFWNKYWIISALNLMIDFWFELETWESRKNLDAYGSSKVTISVDLKTWQIEINSKTRRFQLISDIQRLLQK